MEKQLKDYLHLYLGCDVQYNRHTEISKTPIQAKRKLNLECVLTLMELSDLVGAEGHITDVKLILRPLSAMTEDEHALYCNIDEVSYKGGRFLSLTHNADEVLFLLRCGFDLFGLIEAGLAIDSTLPA